MGHLILDDGGKNMWVGAEGACSGDEGENVAGDDSAEVEYDCLWLEMAAASGRSTPSCILFMLACITSMLACIATTVLCNIAKGDGPASSSHGHGSETMRMALQLAVVEDSGMLLLEVLLEGQGWKSSWMAGGGGEGAVYFVLVLPNNPPVYVGHAWWHVDTHEANYLMHNFATTKYNPNVFELFT